MGCADARRTRGFRSGCAARPGQACSRSASRWRARSCPTPPIRPAAGPAPGPRTPARIPSRRTSPSRPIGPRCRSCGLTSRPGCRARPPSFPTATTSRVMVWTRAAAVPPGSLGVRRRGRPLHPNTGRLLHQHRRHLVHPVALRGCPTDPADDRARDPKLLRGPYESRVVPRSTRHLRFAVIDPPPGALSR